jgi:hypothetical protein
MLRGDTEPAAAPHTSAEVFERSAKAGLRIHEVDQAIAAAAARKRCGSWQSGAADNYRDWLALSTVEMRHKR